MDNATQNTFLWIEIEKEATIGVTSRFMPMRRTYNGANSFTNMQTLVFGSRTTIEFDGLYAKCHQVRSGMANIA